MDRTQFGRGRFVKRTFKSEAGSGSIIMYIDHSIKGRAYLRLRTEDQKILAHGHTAGSARRLARAMGWTDSRHTIQRYREAQRRFEAAVLAVITKELAGVRVSRSRRAVLLRLRQELK